MTTAEKRAQMEAAGEPWPDCECHGAPMAWNKKPNLIAGGHFRCRARASEWKRRHRDNRKKRNVCIFCGGQLDTETLCRDCADEHADRMAEPKQKLLHQLAQVRHRRRDDEDFQPLGVGLAAFRKWRSNATGEATTGSLPREG